MANSKRGKQTPFVLFPEDFEVINEMRKKYGFDNRSVVVRFALHLVADAFRGAKPILARLIEDWNGKEEAKEKEKEKEVKVIMGDG